MTKKLVLPRIKIGADSIIGDIPDKVTVVGVPAREIFRKGSNHG